MHRRRLLRHAVFAPTSALLLAACGRKRTANATPLPAGAKVLALGDSLTAGYGAGPEASWPTKLAELTGWQVINEGVNGDTSEGARARLGPLLAEQQFDAILVGIGGNDMLRSVPRERTIANLRAIAQEARDHSTHVALIATPAPDVLRASIGSLSDADFYADVADDAQVLLLPAIYAPVLSERSLRSDQIHANAKGYARIAELMAEQLQEAGWR